MKTTIYELLGLVKDNKPPKKIIYRNKIFDYEDSDYFNNTIGYLFELYSIFAILNDEVEILEEPKGIPKKIDNQEIGIAMSIGELICANRINKIIDYLESKGE